MRSSLLVPLVLAIAACGDGTPTTGPSEAQPTPALASGNALRIAVDDAVDRLVPGLAADAAGPIGASLRDLGAHLRSPNASPIAVRSSSARAREVIASFRSPDRTDLATLDALSLELSIDQ